MKQWVNALLTIASILISAKAVADSNDDFFKFPTEMNEKNYFQTRPSCQIIASQVTADESDKFGIEEHSSYSNVATLNLELKKKAVADIGYVAMDEAEVKGAGYLAQLPESYLIRSIDRQSIKSGNRVYRLIATRRADLFVNSCPTPEEAAKYSKDQSWTLEVQEGVSLRIDAFGSSAVPLSDQRSYNARRMWKTIYKKIIPVDSGPDGYKMHQIKVKDLQLNYECVQYIPTCVG